MATVGDDSLCTGMIIRRRLFQCNFLQADIAVVKKGSCKYSGLSMGGFTFPHRRNLLIWTLLKDFDA